MASATPKARIVLQQCLSARLMVQPASEDNEAEYVHIDRGLIIYICFMKEATDDIVDKMVKAALNTRLSASDDGPLVSVLDLPGDVLIIPQATLGGCLKGKLMQYHKNIDKEEGLRLYKLFVEKCRQMMESNTKCQEGNKQVKAGTYGNRQVFRTDTNGPYTHLVEFT